MGDVIEPLLTVEDLAEWIRVSPHAIHQQRLRNQKPGSLGIRVGARVLFRPETISRWLEELEDNNNGRVHSSSIGSIQKVDRPKPYRVRWYESGHQASKSFEDQANAERFLANRAAGLEQVIITRDQLRTALGSDGSFEEIWVSLHD